MSGQCRRLLREVVSSRRAASLSASGSHAPISTVVRSVCALVFLPIATYLATNCRSTVIVPTGLVSCTGVAFFGLVAVVAFVRAEWTLPSTQSLNDTAASSPGVPAKRAPDERYAHCR
jgi:hypothetical protein